MTKRAFKYVLLFSVLLFAQLSIVPLLAVYGVYPDLILVGIILIAIRHGAIPAMLFGFFAGLGQDIVLSQLYGLHALSKTIAGFVAAQIAGSKAKFDLQTTLGLAFISAFAHNLVYDGVYYINLGFGVVLLLMRYVLPNTVYTVAFVAILQILNPANFARRKFD